MFTFNVETVQGHNYGLWILDYNPCSGDVLVDGEDAFTVMFNRGSKLIVRHH